jgi:hypothetical protein
VQYDTWNPYDAIGGESSGDKAHLRKRLLRDREIVRAMFPHLREEIENRRRDSNSVFEMLRPYYRNAREVPMTPEDLPEIESLCWLVLERGGARQSEIQTVLLRLVGATAAPSSVPFLLEMLHYSRRGDQFGLERRQLALWGLARIAIFHDVPEAYEALQEGLEDHHADVRFTTADLILNAYLDKRSAHQKVPQDVVDRLQDLARTDPDDSVRRVVRRYLREPWAQSHDMDEDIARYEG